MAFFLMWNRVTGHPQFKPADAQACISAAARGKAGLLAARQSYSMDLGSGRGVVDCSGKSEF